MIKKHAESAESGLAAAINATQINVSDYIYIGAISVLFFVGFFGNALIVTIVAINKHLRTPMNLFLMNLAIGDFFVVLLCLPVTTMESIAQVWYGGVFTCKFVKFLQTASVLASVMWLTALSIERRRIITKAETSLTVIERGVATKRCYMTCLLIWFTAFVFACPMPLILEIRVDLVQCDYMKHLSLVSKGYEYFLFGIMICLPVVVIAIMQCNVAAVLLRQSNPAIIVNSEESCSCANSIVNGVNLHYTNQSSKVQFCEHPANQFGPGMTTNICGERSNREHRLLSLNLQVVSTGQHLSLKAWKRTANILIFLVFMLALSYLPLCVLTFIYSLLEDNEGAEYIPNDNSSLEAEFVASKADNENTTAGDAPEHGFDWKPCFLFAHFIFYVYPSLNPFVFYILSRRLRVSIKGYCMSLLSRCTLCTRCTSTRYAANESAQDGIYHNELDSFLEAIRTHVTAGTNRRNWRRFFHRRRGTGTRDVTQRFVFMLGNR